MAVPQKAYRINLIRDLRSLEMKAEQRRRLMTIGATGCFAVLALALVYSALTIWNMESVLAVEKRKVDHLRSEYLNYTGTKMTVDKADVELLTSLQGRGIFWTGKLASMAKHLPGDYSIDRLAFREGELRVTGFGFATAKQDHLLVLDGYIQDLRRDTSFSNVFLHIQLNKAERRDEEGGRIAFEFSALTREARSKK